MQSPYTFNRYNRRPRRPGFPRPSSDAWFLSEMFADQARRPWTKTRTSAMTISTGTSDSTIQGGEDVKVLRSLAYDSYSMWQEIGTVVNCMSFYSRYVYDGKSFTVFQTGNGRLALILYFWTIFLIFGLSPSYAACVNEDLVDLDILARPGYCWLNFFKAFLRTKLAKPCDRVATSPMNKATLKNLILAL